MAHVADGELTLSYNHLFRAHISPHDSSRHESMEMQVDGVHRAGRSLGGARCLPRPTSGIDCLGEEPGQDNSVAYLLPVIKGELEDSQLIARTWSRVELVLYGLILRAGNDFNEPSHFQRIGSFRVTKTTGALLSSLSDTLSDTRAQGQRKTPCSPVSTHFCGRQHSCMGTILEGFWSLGR